MEREFWTGFLQIIWIDVLLSGDNAVVIALACRSLPRAQRRLGIALGASAAIVLRLIFATFIVHLMAVPLLKIAGGLLLLWIAIKLVAHHGDDDESVVPGATLFAATRSIVIADAVMSLDNVVAIAAASRGNIVLLALGLLISVPLILFGSALILRLIVRFPATIYAGAGLLGWISGETLVTDPVLVDWVEREAPFLDRAGPAAGALASVAFGWARARVSVRGTPRDRKAAASIAAEHGNAPAANQRNPGTVRRVPARSRPEG
jgi:YjbE family integral membrane protein